MFGFPERSLEPPDPGPCYCDDGCTCECECDVECAPGEHPCACATWCECDVAGDAAADEADRQYDAMRCEDLAS